MLGEVKLGCPTCGSTLKVSLDDVAAQRSRRCPRGHRVEVVDEGGGVRKAQAAERKFDQSVKDLQRRLGRLGR